MNKQIEPDAPPRDAAFSQILSGHSSGTKLDEIGAALREATEAATLVGKPAKVIIELTVSNTAQNALAVTIKVKSKLPEVPETAAIFFADENYNLVRNDPRQVELALRVVQNNQAMQGASESLRKAEAV
jgi:hypothetical protein